MQLTPPTAPRFGQSALWIFCSAILVVVFLFLPSRGVLAQDLQCSFGDGCDSSTDFVWLEDTMGLQVTPNEGGAAENANRHVSLRFPPHSVSTRLTIAFTSSLTSPIPADLSLHKLGYFTIAATGAAEADWDATLAPWTLTVTYDDCVPGAPCRLNLADEASLRCVQLDAAHATWQPVPSVVDVFTNQVTCSSEHFGQFALVADPLGTSGQLDQATVYLPLLRR